MTLQTVKVSELTSSSGIEDTDLLMTVKDISGTLSTRKATALQIAEYVTSSIDVLSIGKTFPNSTLDVSGNVLITGSLTTTETIIAENSEFINLTASNALITNNLKISGAFILSEADINSAYSVNGTDCIIFATGGPYTITIPSPLTNTGRQLIIKKAENSEITITLSASAGTIDGSIFELNGPYQSITLVSNGTDWLAV